MKSPLAIFALAGALLANASAFAAGLDRVQASWLPITQSLPFYIAIEEKLFEKHGIELVHQKFQLPPQIIESLIADRSDVAFGAAVGLTVVAEAEQPGTFKVFGLQGGSNKTQRVSDTLIVKADSPISSIKDFSGKSIATLPGIQWRLLGRQMLRKNGVDPDSVKFVPIQLGMQAQAVAAGSVDGALALEPIGTMAVASGLVKRVVSNPGATYIAEPFYSSAFVMTDRFIKQRPAVARRLVAAMDEATRLANRNFDAYKPLFTKYMAVPAADLSYVTAPYLRGFDEMSQVDLQSWQVVADIFQAEGAMKQRVDVTTAVYRSGGAK
jgi:NitT/TauT family transport system substrate-binding protein